MTIEEKAKAYDEALERAKEYHDVDKDNTMQVYARGVMEYLFPELKENEDEIMRAMAIKAVHAPEAQSCIKSWGINPDDVVAWLEKQGEQKPTEVVEPKFKVGDWIVCCDYEPVQIIDITSEMYDWSNGDSRPIEMIDNNQNIHLWSIKDAKDGDVLVCGEQLFLFKRMNTSNSFYAHCNYHFIGYDSLSVYDCSYSINNIYPATKEQCELLFTKMKEAGYEWVPEKKELKTIEKNNIWSEEDEKIYSRIYDLIHEVAYANYEVDEVGNELGEYAKIINWLKSLKDRVLSQNTITDEELAHAKKDAYNEALDKIEYTSDHPTFDDGWEAAIWYLKKKGYTPKKNIEWIKAKQKIIDWTVDFLKYNGFEDEAEKIASLKQNFLCK